MSTLHNGSNGLEQLFSIGDAEIGWKDIKRDSQKQSIEGDSQYEYLESLGTKLTRESRQVLDTFLHKWMWTVQKKIAITLRRQKSMRSHAQCGGSSTTGQPRRPWGWSIHPRLHLNRNAQRWRNRKMSISLRKCFYRISKRHQRQIWMQFLHSSQNLKSFFTCWTPDSTWSLFLSRGIIWCPLACWLWRS